MRPQHKEDLHKATAIIRLHTRKRDDQTCFTGFVLDFSMLFYCCHRKYFQEAELGKQKNSNVWRIFKSSPYRGRHFNFHNIPENCKIY